MHLELIIHLNSFDHLNILTIKSIGEQMSFRPYQVPRRKLAKKEETNKNNVVKDIKVHYPSKIPNTLPYSKYPTGPKLTKYANMTSLSNQNIANADKLLTSYSPSLMIPWDHKQINLQSDLIMNDLFDTPEERVIFLKFSYPQHKDQPNSNAGISSRIDSKQTPIHDVHEFERSFEYKVNVPNFDDSMKIRVFTFIKSKLTKEAQWMIEEIVSKSKGRNQDNTTGYMADDLFFYLLLNGEGEDLLKNIDEQMADAFRLGQCPQGRTIRILQLVNAFCSG